MLSALLRKISLLSLALSLASGMGGFACIGGAGVGGGPVGPPSGITGPNGAAPEVLGSVTGAPDIQVNCNFSVSMRFAGEGPELADEDGNLPFVIQATPGQTGFDKAVVERLGFGPQKPRTPCPECKDRLLRILDFGIYGRETIQPQLTNNEVPIDSAEGVRTYFSNEQNNLASGSGPARFAIKIQDFSYDEAAQAYPLRNWLFQNKGMYMILLAPPGTVKIETPQGISTPDLLNMLSGTSETPEGRCLNFPQVREVRTLYPTATLAAPPSSNGIVHPADDSDDTPLYQFNPGSIRRIPFNSNLDN